MSTFHDRVTAIVERIQYKPNYGIRIGESEGRLFIQVHANVDCAVTGEHKEYRGGKRFLSEHMVDGELVQLTFAAFLAFEEHECREFFQLDGKAIFGPHINPLALLEVCDRTVQRENP